MRGTLQWERTLIFMADTEESASDDFGWANIYAHVKKSRNRNKQKKLLPWYSAGIAASLIMMIVSLIFFVNDNSDDIRHDKDKRAIPDLEKLCKYNKLDAGDCFAR